MHLPYRADIDGLRAFAVLSVVIFHAFPSLIPGGFVGVDVFFVISGFLISGILFKEIESGKFSFASFYARRIKRIFPALILMLVASYFFGWFFLFNEDFRRLGSHIFRASLFLSNFILWREAGYFDHAAETKPLLHLWSLGIEEQFYIVWPCILFCFWRFKALRWPLVLLLTGSSFAWNIFQSQQDLTHDFYSPLTRFWELSAGACMALYLSHQTPRQSFKHGVSALSFLILACAIFLIDSKKPFPGWWALLPVAGAMMVIYAGPTAWLNKVILSSRGMVWVGSISYPLYLWHWPALAFARIVEGATPSITIRLAVVMGAVLLAWGTFVWIEKPIRFGSKSPLRTPMLLLAMVVVGYVGLMCKKSDGYPSRSLMQSRTEVHQGDIGHDEFHTFYADNFFPCADERVLNGSQKWGSLIRCFQTKRDKPIDLVIIGDSHAEHMLLGLSEELPHLNIAVYPRSELPFISSSEYKEIFDSVLSHPQLKYVLMTSMWAVSPLSSDEKITFQKNLQDTVNVLTSSGKHVFLTDDTPKFGFDPQRCKFSHPLSGRSHCEESADAYRQVHASYFSLLEQVQNKQNNVHLIRLDDLFCVDEICQMARHTTIYFRDTNHVNILGSKLMGARVAEGLSRHDPVFFAR